MIDLNQQLERWLADGIITDDQAELMRHSVPARQPDEPEQRIPLVAEILGYVGAALAIWAVMFLVAEFWDTLDYWAQMGLFGVLAFALFSGGLVLLDATEPALRRLSSMLWAGSVLALGGALWVLFDPVLDLSVETSWLALSAIAAVVAALMLRRQTSIPQHLTLFAAVIAAIAWFMTVTADPELLAYGVVVWGIGLVWVLVTRAGVLRPELTGMVAGALAMFYGAQMVVIDDTSAGIWLGLFSAAGFATIGVALQEKGTILLGGVGIFWFVPQLMFHFFGDTFGGMMGLLLSGLAIVGLAIWFSRSREST